MNYVKDVLGYYFKNFLFILVFAIVPAVAMGLLLQPFALFEFLYNYPSYKLLTFGDMFYAVYGLNWLDILWILIGLVLIVISISLLLGFIENHYKTGNATFKMEFSLNSNILSVFKTTILLAIIIFVINVVIMLLMYFVHFLTAVNGVATVWGSVINYILAILGLYPIARIFSVFAFSTVEMLINGSPLLVAMSNASLAIAKNSWHVFFMELILFLIPFALVILTNLLGVAWLGNILGLIYVLPAICVFGMSMFFDFYGIKRYDNHKYYYVR